jgi:hypothetical protein
LICSLRRRKIRRHVLSAVVISLYRQPEKPEATPILCFQLGVSNFARNWLGHETRNLVPASRG